MNILILLRNEINIFIYICKYLLKLLFYKTFQEFFGGLNLFFLFILSEFTIK
jgi:hypothetical protein